MPQLTRWSTALVLCAAGCAAESEPPALSDLAAAGEEMFVAIADARVESNQPTRNFGASPDLVSDASPATETYLRFDLTGLTGEVESARLLLHVTNGSGNGPEVSLAAGAWSESGITYDNRPGPAGGPIGDLGAISAGTLVEVDVTSAVTAGMLDLVLTSTSRDGSDFDSRETSHPPALAVRTAAAPDPEPDPDACGAELIFTPVADARVEAGAPDRSFGADPELIADGEPYTESYLRFDVTGVEGDVISSRLRLHTTNGSSNGPAVHATASGWDESTLTYASRPAAEGPALDDAGSVATGDVLELDVTPLVFDNGTFSMVLVPTSRDGYDAHAREGAAPPELVVVTGHTGDCSGGGDDGGGEPPPPSSGAVTASVETDPVPSSSDAADDAAVWLHPTDRARSTIIGTDKLGGLAVYDLTGAELYYYTEFGRMNNVDIRYGFPLGGQKVDLVIASNKTDNSLAALVVDPATRGLRSVAARPLTVGIGLYGLCMYRSRSSGRYYAFDSDSSGTVQQWELFDDGAGRVDARKVREFRLSSVTEGCVVDDEHGALYLAQEDVAIWRYGAEPGDGTTRTMVDGLTSAGGNLSADIEGLTLYLGSQGDGYLIASSQGANEYVVYERAGANAHVLTFQIEAGEVDGVSYTDGIDVSSASLGPAFPDGVFIAQDDKNDGGNQNYKLVPWSRIAGAADPPLLIDTGYDPRAADGGDETSVGTTYYLDPDAGLDSNDGLAPDRAWRTLDRASSATLAPGDRLLLRRGAVFSGRLAMAESGTGDAPIQIGSYGSGALPVIRGGGSPCVRLDGSYIAARELQVEECGFGGFRVAGSHNLVEASVIRGNMAGVYLPSGSHHNAILGNQIVDNNVMSVLTAGGDDDSGAFGLVVHGDDNEIAYNEISGSDAFSYDYGRDGAAVEIYGGQRNHIHHNLARDNDAFTELGHSRSQDNVFAYNLVTSSLDTSVFLVTRGADSSYGPVLGTRAIHNTVHLTGASSQGFVCHAGCGPDIFEMTGNVVVAAWKVGYADAAFPDQYNVYHGGQRQFEVGSTSLVADPQLVAPGSGDFRLAAGSPAIDSAPPSGYATDLDGRPVPRDGDGDGVAAVDRGCYER